MHKEITRLVFRPHRLPDYLLAFCPFCWLTIGECWERGAGGPTVEKDHLGKWAEADCVPRRSGEQKGKTCYGSARQAGEGEAA